MIGILVQLALSWLIVWLFERNNLRVLGLAPTRGRMLDFGLFFLVTGFCCLLDFLMKMGVLHQRWVLNPKLAPSLIIEGLWWNLKSVLFEELIFRGVLLYILVKKLGTIRAIIISSIAFGIYHWFSQEAWGNPVQMAIIFVLTGTMGLIYAYGYTKTFSLYVPCAIHLGWNLVRSVGFSETVIGGQLFVPVTPPAEVTVSYFVYFVLLLLPIVSAIGINFLLLKRKRQAVVM